MAGAGWGPPGAPGYGEMPAAPMAATPSGYEFSAWENATIAKVGSRAKTWGIMSILFGILLVTGAGLLFSYGAKEPKLVPIGGAVLAIGIQPVVSGAFYFAAGSALASVVTTQGNDIPLMMRALRKLTHAVRVEAIAAIVTILVGAYFGFLFTQGK